jgi:acyl carrier protein
MLTALAGTSTLEQKGGDEGNRIREVLLQAKPDECEEIVQAYIREQVARVLGASAAKLDADRPLNELGLDSLMGVELKNRVESDLAQSLPMRELMQSPTINSLSRAILGQLTAPASAPQETSSLAQETTEQLSARIAQLSDEEVNSLLSEMLDENTVELEHLEEEMRG